MMKADGMPLDMAKSLYNNMKFHWTSSADGVKWTEYLGNGSKDTFCAKFDEEFEKPNPFPGAMILFRPKWNGIGVELRAASAPASAYR